MKYNQRNFQRNNFNNQTKNSNNSKKVESTPVATPKEVDVAKEEIVKNGTDIKKTNLEKLNSNITSLLEKYVAFHEENVLLKTDITTLNSELENSKNEVKTKNEELEGLRNSLTTQKAENEAKSLEIERLNRDLASKDKEIAEIISKIESILK